VVAKAGVVLAALGLVCTASAAKTIYRCEKDGHITLTDKESGPIRVLRSQAIRIGGGS
jgi:hypothetical protein